MLPNLSLLTKSGTTDLEEREGRREGVYNHALLRLAMKLNVCLSVLEKHAQMAHTHHMLLT